MACEQKKLLAINFIHVHWKNFSEDLSYGFENFCNNIVASKPEPISFWQDLVWKTHSVLEWQMFGMCFTWNFRSTWNGLYIYKEIHKIHNHQHLKDTAEMAASRGNRQQHSERNRIMFEHFSYLWLSMLGSTHRSMPNMRNSYKKVYIFTS